MNSTKDLASAAQPIRDRRCMAKLGLGRRRARSAWAGILGAAALLAVAPAYANQVPRDTPNGFTWGELALLPPYCKDTQGTVWGMVGGSDPLAPDTPKWVALMGEDFFHSHHYCYGLRNILRAENAGVNSVRGKDLLKRALSEFAYMFRNCSPAMPLMPEIYLKEGEVHLMLGNIVDAGNAFERSRKLKPTYWPAYTRWTDVLISLKQVAAARALLLDGLAHSPDEPELKKRLADLSDPQRSRGAVRSSAPASR